MSREMAGVPVAEGGAAAGDCGPVVTDRGEPTSIRVGSTLVCPTCRASAVVMRITDTQDRPACHEPMRVGRSVPCHERRPRRTEHEMVAGRTYVDAASGLVLRCTRGGPMVVRVSGRHLNPMNSVAPTVRRGN